MGELGVAIEDTDFVMAVDTDFVMAYIAKILPLCHEKVQAAVDLQASEQKARVLGLNSKVHLVFKSDTPAYVKTRAKKDLNTAMEKGGDLQINGKVVYCTLEPPDEIKPLNKQLGRFFGMVQGSGLAKKDFYGKYVNGTTIHVKHIASGKIVAVYASNSGWTINDANWEQEVASISVDVARARLK